MMVIGMGDDPVLGDYERLLLSMKTTARKELVLLHPTRSVIPGSTREWLKVIAQFQHFFLTHFSIESTMGSSTYSRRTSGQILRILGVSFLRL